MPTASSFAYEDENIEIHEPDPGGGTGQQQGEPIRAHRFVWREPELLPRRAWLYPGLYVRQFVSITIGGGAVGKTGECLVEGIALVLGRDLLRIGHRFPAGKQRRVWYWNGEDPLVETERQVYAVYLHYRLGAVDRDGLTERPFLDSGRDSPIDLVKEGARGAILVNGPAQQQIIDTIRGNRIDLAIFDPVADFMTAAGNSNEAMSILVRTCGAIAAECDCAIGLVHHPRKTSAQEISTEDARGGSALVAGTRVARVLNRMTADEGAKAGIKGNAYRRYFRMSSDKINLTAPEDDITWRYIDAVTLPNGVPDDPLNADGDSVRVVTRWEWPNAFAGLRNDQITAFQDALDAEARLIRLDPQSANWVGFLLARILDEDTRPAARRKSDLTAKQVAARSRCRQMINTWLESGLLVRDTMRDERRDRDVDIARVGARHEP